MKKLILATSNPGKLAEIGEYLTDIDLELQLKPDDLEIEETGATFAENAYLKAAQIALTLGEWSIADDSGLEVTGLGNAPGIYSARYGENDRERIDRLVRELGDNQDRSARFVCVIAIARPDGEIALSATGICTGEILTSPRGEGGFKSKVVHRDARENHVYSRGLFTATFVPRTRNLNCSGCGSSGFASTHAEPVGSPG